MVDQDLLVHYGLEDSAKKLLNPDNFPVGSSFVSAVQNRVLKITAWQKAADQADVAIMVRSEPGSVELGLEEVKHEIRKEVWVYEIPQEESPADVEEVVGDDLPGDEDDLDDNFGDDLEAADENGIPEEETAAAEDDDILPPEEVVPEPEEDPEIELDEDDDDAEAEERPVAEIESDEVAEPETKNPAEQVGDVYVYANGIPNPDAKEDGSRTYKVIPDSTLGKPGNKSHLVMYCAARGMKVDEAVQLGIDQQLYQNLISGRSMFLRVVRKLKTMGWGVFFDEEKDMVWLSENGIVPYITDVLSEERPPLNDGEALSAKIKMNMGIAGPRDLPKPLQHALSGMEEELSTLPKKHAAGIAHLAYGIYLIIHGD